MTILLSLLISTAAFAEAPVLNPQALHWCAGAMGVKAPGDHPSDVADRNRAITEAMDRVGLVKRPESTALGRWAQRMTKALHAYGGVLKFHLADFTKPIRSSSVDDTVAILEQRLAEIADAAVNPDPDSILVSRVVRGQEKIDRYFADIEANARRIDAEQAVRKDPPYFQILRWLAPSFWLGFSAGITHDFANQLVQHFHSNPWSQSLLPSAGVAIGALIFVTELRKIATYFAGYYNERARTIYRNRYEVSRRHGYHADVTDLAARTDSGARPLGYLTITHLLTHGQAERLLSAAGGRVTATTGAHLDQSVGQDVRRLDIDVISYRGDDGVPAILSVFRVTRVLDGFYGARPARAQPRPAAPPLWPRGA